MHSDLARGTVLTRVRQLVVLGLFVGTTVGSGYLLSGLPNVETMTLLTAVAGGALGVRFGVVAGVLAAATYSLGSPYGPAVPVLLAAQCLGLGAAGGLGGVVGPVLSRRLAARRRRGAMVLAGVTGLAATVVYDGLTNLASAIAFALDLRVVLIGGAGFAVLHAGSNLVLFATLYPPLVARARLLIDSTLRGRSATGLLVGVLGLLSADPVHADLGTAAAPDTLRAVTAADSAAVAGAAVDTLAGAVVDTLAARPGEPAAAVTGTARDRNAAWSSDRYAPGWQRPLWNPFRPSLQENIDLRTRWRSLPDGGLGSVLVYLNEAGTSPQPLLLRNGIPLFTGHRLADDGWTYPISGLRFGRVAYGRDGWGGSDGVIDLVSGGESEAAQRAGGAIADTRWFKGPHETYLRSLALQTPNAPWQFAFGFEEILDNEGYDFRVPGDSRYDSPETGRGHAKYRSGRGSLRRSLDDDTSLTVEFEAVRKNKWSQPAYDRENMDLWSQLVGVIWRDATPAGRLRATFFWIDRDVEWDRAVESLTPAIADRKIEASREGVRLELTGGDRRQAWLGFSGWRLADSGETAAWAGPAAGPIRARGEEANAAAATGWRFANLGGTIGLQADWDSYGGGLLGGWLELAPDRERPWWRLTCERGGRAPRSDELLTPWTYAVPGRDIPVLPNRELAREQTWRAALELTGEMAGIDLAAIFTARWLDHGIGFAAGATDTSAGSWANDLRLSGRTATLSAAWGGRFLGWLRIRASATWRGHDLHAGLRPNLPPGFDATLQLLWENHFFHEDGILQAGYFLVHRGSLSDPWSLDRSYDLDPITRHDLFLGFRLVGANLSVALRNLAGDPLRLSAGSLSPGREFQWRLHWVFYK